jgi:protein-L-isoaspartate(D-aspartate) O-methyltransferase
MPRWSDDPMTRWSFPRDITDARVLAAMAKVPREAFVPAKVRPDAHADRPLPIGFGQTISQPYIVAWMTQELRVAPDTRVLEIGTGSGYQAAILAELGAEVFSVEIVPELAERARQALAALGYTRVHIRVGSGYDGWPEHAPFDRILLTASPPAMPQTLIDQLADGGRLVGPVGVHAQFLEVIERHGDRITRRETMPVMFVPMVRT